MFKKEVIKMCATVKDLRAATGWTQEEFANYFKVSRITVQSWERGVRNCPPGFLELMEYKLINENIVKPSPD